MCAKTGHQDNTNPLQNSATSQSERAFTWRTGLVYLFDSGIAPYASFAKSFDPQAGVLYGGCAAKPTTAQQYEVGVKYQPRGYNSFITASLFNLTEHNVLTSDPLHPGFSTQAGEVRARGLELEGHASLTNNLDLVASYTYLNNVTIESNDSTTTLDGGDNVAARQATLEDTAQYRVGVARLHAVWRQPARVGIRRGRALYRIEL